MLAARKFAAKYRKDVQGISSQACAALLNHSWPGNLAELNRVVERAVLTCLGSQITSGQLPMDIQGDFEEQDVEKTRNLVATLDSIEKALIVDALKVTNGNRAKAAELLGISERLMGLRVRKHDLARRYPRSHRGPGAK